MFDFVEAHETADALADRRGFAGFCLVAPSRVAKMPRRNANQIAVAIRAGTSTVGWHEFAASCRIYPGFVAVTFHEVESIMTPFGR